MPIAYPKDFRDAVVKDALSGEYKNYSEVADKHHVSMSCVRRWVIRAKAAASGESNKDKAADDKLRLPKSSRPPLPRGWTLSRMLGVIGVRELLGADSTEFGAYCRTKGIQPNEVETAANWLDGCDVVDSRAFRASQQENKSLARKIKELDYELSRKDKALAESAALLVLSKKVQAIWGEPAR